MTTDNNGGAPNGGAPNGGAPNGGAPNGGTPAAHWSGLTDAADIAYVDNKGWKATADVFKSYRGVETLVGRDPNTLVAMPRLDDPTGVRAVMQKLGLPETADKYDFGKPAAGDPAFDEGYLAWARGAFHKAGLPADMAKALMSEHNAYVKTVLETQQSDANLRVTTEKANLQREWGGGFERMMNAAKTAATALGFTQPMIDAIESQVGYGGTMKFFATLGQKLGEDKFVSAGAGPKFDGTLTPVEAKAQWDAAMMDPNFTAALRDKQHPGHKAAAAKQTQLFNIMHPEK